MNSSQPGVILPLPMKLLPILVVISAVVFLAIVIYSAATRPCEPGPQIADWFVVAGCKPPSERRPAGMHRGFD